MTEAQKIACEEAMARGLTLYQFISLCESEELNDEELNDLDFLLDRIDVWLEGYEGYGQE